MDGEHDDRPSGDAQTSYSHGSGGRYVVGRSVDDDGDGYSECAGDCDDAVASTHPGAAKRCNGLPDDGAAAIDSDQDGHRDACDDCPVDFDPSQSDSDHDGVGDVCDLGDDLIWEWRDDRTSVSWQAENGPTSWKLYIGDLEVLRTTGAFTQVPESNPLATRQCGLTQTVGVDLVVPQAGKVSFSLVTGVSSGEEGPLGSGSAGPRPNANSCP